MVKSEQCTEFQVVVHVLLIFAIGALIGTSLVSETDNLEVELYNDTNKLKGDFAELITKYNKKISSFEEDYELLKQHGLAAYEMNCLSLTNYFIDNSVGNDLKIEFSDRFYKEPVVYLSINGFKYNPSLIRAEGESEVLSFSITSITNSEFRFAIESSVDDFKKTDFDGLEICYLAFVHYDPKEFKK